MKSKYILTAIIMSTILSFGALVSVASDLVIESKNQSYSEEDSKIKFDGDVNVTIDDLHIVGDKADVTVINNEKLDTATFYDKPYAFENKANKKREVKANILKVLSMVLAITGIFLLTKVVQVESFLGVIYALITTVTYGVYIVANKKCSFAELDTMVSVFYMSLIVSVVFFIVGIFTNSLQLLNNLYVFYNFAAIALLCTIFSLGLLLYGVKRLGSSLASILNMFEPTTTVVASIFIYNEDLTINIVIGSVLIILSTISMVIGSKN